MATKRLEKILSVLPRCNVLADVGCDHGYVGLGALERDLAQRVVFVDISLPSLQKAQRNCPQSLKTRATFVCRNGLGDLDVDCAVIAGMGGMEIISVLDNAKTLPQNLVLQPMRNQQDVRLRLLRDYEILTDETFFDGKFYDLITAVKGKGCSLTHEQLVFGKDNLKKPSADFVAYLQKLQKEYQQILSHCNDVALTEKYDEVLRILAKIMEEGK